MATTIGKVEFLTTYDAVGVIVPDTCAHESEPLSVKPKCRRWVKSAVFPGYRMIPVDGNATLGRSGLLAHSYLLGPNADSNGCVSIKDYEKFLRAFKSGGIKRLVVVPSLNDRVLASPRSTSQS